MTQKSGIKQNNIRLGDGASWEDIYEIDAGALTNATRENFHVERKVGSGYEFVECTYVGVSPLTLSEFNNFPAGSRIFWANLGCTTLGCTSAYIKEAATTWRTIAGT